MHASNPSEILGAFCERLRQRESERRHHGSTAASTLVARFSRELLRQCPGDAELAEAVRRLAERGFALPAPPPEALPLVDAGATFARWPLADRIAVASATIALPSFQAEPQKVRSLFELFIRTPNELGRARMLLDAMPKQGEDTPLLQFRLALAELGAAGTRPDWGKLLQPLRRLTDPSVLHAALRLACSYELQQTDPARRPLGLGWLAPLAEGTAIANVALALMRRPALGDEAPRIIDWLVEAGQPPWLASVDHADRRGDFAAGTRLLTEALTSHASPDEAETALIARRSLLEDPTGGLRGATATFAPPIFPELVAPRNGWNNILSEVLGRAPISVLSNEEAAIADVVGDRRVVAEYRLQAKDLAASLDARILGRARVVSELALTPPLDERDIPNAVERALACHCLMDAGLERSLLGLRLVGAGVQPLSLDDSNDEPEAPAPSETPDAGDTHAPEQRVAAARILIDSEQIEAAAAIAVSLLRKADRASASAGLYPLIADLLALDEPPEELTAQVKRALEDDKKNLALLTLFGTRPLAAFGLHEELYDFAIDPSRPDAKRLLALTAWLGIWRATETAPDAWGLRRIRETSEALVAVAAARLAGGPSPLATASAFMASSHDLEDEPFADALSALSLNRGLLG